MQEIVLLRSTENERTNVVLRATIGIFEQAFPGQIRACYIEGSYADQSAVFTSDIDLVIVLKEDASSELERAEALAQHCCALSIVELDIGIADENKLAVGVPPYFKMGSLLIYKEFLLSELQAEDAEGRNMALWVLDQIVYQDEEIERAVALAKSAE